MSKFERLLEQKVGRRKLITRTLASGFGAGFGLSGIGLSQSEEQNIPGDLLPNKIDPVLSEISPEDFNLAFDKILEEGKITMTDTIFNFRSTENSDGQIRFPTDNHSLVTMSKGKTLRNLGLVQNSQDIQPTPKTIRKIFVVSPYTSTSKYPHATSVSTQMEIDLIEGQQPLYRELTFTGKDGAIESTTPEFAALTPQDLALIINSLTTDYEAEKRRNQRKLTHGSDFKA